MAEQEQVGLVAALYGTLVDAEGALDALLAAGVPYEHMHLDAHDSTNPLPASVSVELPERFWSLAVKPAEGDTAQLEEQLGEHRPLAVGTMRAPNIERSDPERGNTAWGHFVFDSPASTNQQPEAAGTGSGTTGIISSGAFTDEAHVSKQ
jgi:hypothetical protein